jgi:ABC-2 type transport system ATP-binding protein
LAIGLLRPTEGVVRLFGEPLRLDRPAGLARIGFVAQDHPLYRRFTVAAPLRTLEEPPVRPRRRAGPVARARDRPGTPRGEAVRRPAGPGRADLDHVALLQAGRVRLAGAIDDLLAEHRPLIDPHTDDLGEVDG